MVRRNEDLFELMSELISLREKVAQAERAAARSSSPSSKKGSGTRTISCEHEPDKQGKASAMRVRRSRRPNLLR
jgi:hypothetical protein